MTRSCSCSTTRASNVATSRRAPLPTVRPFAATLVTYIVLSSAAPVAHASCDKEANARPDSTCVLMARQGVKGMWFRLAEADELRKMALTVEQLSLQIQQYSALDAARTREVAALNGALGSRAAANDALKVEVAKAVQAASAAEADATAARKELDRWWRSPVVWLSVGALAGALVGIAIAH